MQQTSCHRCPDLQVSAANCNIDALMLLLLLDQKIEQHAQLQMKLLPKCLLLLQIAAVLE